MPIEYLSAAFRRQSKATLIVTAAFILFAISALLSGNASELVETFTSWKSSNKVLDDKQELPTGLKPVTVVTAYYRIPSKRSHEDYVQWMTNFLSSMPCHLYVFTNKDSYQLVEKLRHPYANITRLIIKEFKDLHMGKLNHVWAENKKRDHESYHTTELYTVWNEKTKFVMEAIQENAFESDYFVWTDIGAFRSAEQVKSLVSFPNGTKVSKVLPPGKMALLLMSDFSLQQRLPDDNDVNMPKSDFSKEVHVGGGVLAGDKSAWRNWDKLYYDMMARFISRGRFAGKDQNIMASVAVIHPESVTLVSPQSYLSGRGDAWFYLTSYFS